MADLGETIDAAEWANEFISATDELKARDQWVCWKYLWRPGAEKPTKPPVDPSTGGGASHSDPRTWTSFKKAWAYCKARSLAGVGFVFSNSDDYTGIDLDACRNAETGVVEPWAQAIIDMAETYCEVSPSGTGLRLIVRGKIDRSYKSDKARVEIYASQRYLTITGNHVEGTPGDIREAPQTIDALLARIDEFKDEADKARERREQERAKAAPPPKFERPTGEREKAWAQAALEGVASELAGVCEGGRNHALNAAAYRMGRIIARGWIDEPSVRAALEDACRQNGLWKSDGPRSVRATLNSGLRAGLANPHEDLEDSENLDELDRMGDEIAVQLERGADGTVYDKEAGDVFEDKIAAPPHKSAPDGLPPDLTRPGGLLEDIIDWICATSRQPSREMSLAAAVAIIGVVAGRQWYGPTESGTHFYMIVLAESGWGKDHVLNAVTETMIDIGMSDCIGPDEFMSQSAVYDHIKKNTLSLCPMDEFGDSLARLQSRKANSYERNIMKTLRSIWGKNLAPMPTSGSVSNPAKLVRAPSLSIFAASTPMQFWDSLKGADIANGFINRFLIFPLSESPPTAIPSRSAREGVPQFIMRRLETIRGDEKVAGLREHPSDPAARFDPRIIRWADDSARELFEDFAKRMKDLPKTEPAGLFFARAAENALRLAQIYALSEDQRYPAVSQRGLEWGIAISKWCFGLMAKGAGLYMSDTEAQEHANSIRRAIGEAGGKISRTGLINALGYKIRGREMDDAIRMLVEGGLVREYIEDTGKPGKKPKLYKLIKD